jgi:branched-subunit amino acid transport protein
MSLEFILVLTAITYGSRMAALVLLPEVPGRLAAVVDRMPSALFAGIAMQSLVAPGPEVAGRGVLAAALGALAVTPLRSLPACLLAGIGAYAVVATLG